MKTFFGKISLALLALGLVLGSALAQNGTPHGIKTSWTAPSPVGGGGIIQGYYLFRCTGTCTLTSTWTAVGALLPPTPTSYLDPASGLSVNTTYSYAAVTVDSNGNQSGFSPIATVAVGASFPPNPNPPSGCSSTVQ